MALSRGGCAAGREFLSPLPAIRLSCLVNQHLKRTWARPRWCRSQTRIYSSLAAGQIDKWKISAPAQQTHWIYSKWETPEAKYTLLLAHFPMTQPALALQRRINHTDWEVWTPPNPTWLPPFLTNACQGRGHFKRVWDGEDTPKPLTGFFFPFKKGLNLTFFRALCKSFSNHML